MEKTNSNVLDNPPHGGSSVQEPVQRTHNQKRSDAYHTGQERFIKVRKIANGFLVSEPGKEPHAYPELGFRDPGAGDEPLNVAEHLARFLGQ